MCLLTSLRGAHYRNLVNRFGGINGSSVRNNDLWLFDLEHKLWDKAMCTGFIPVARSRHRAVVAHGKMYIFGGSGESGVLGDCSALSVDGKRFARISVHRSEISHTECQWQSLAFTGSGPPAQYYATLGVDGSTIVVIGGNAKTANATEPVVYLLDSGKSMCFPSTICRR